MGWMRLLQWSGLWYSFHLQSFNRTDTSLPNTCNAMQCNALQIHTRIYSQWRSVCLFYKKKKENRETAALLLPAQYCNNVLRSLCTLAVTQFSLVLDTLPHSFIHPSIHSFIHSFTYSFDISNCVEYVVNIQNKEGEKRKKEEERKKMDLRIEWVICK